MYMYFFVRFVEELMKIECKILILYILMFLILNRSFSGSFILFYSSKSGFKDSMFLSFEEEFLFISFGRFFIKSFSIK